MKTMPILFDLYFYYVYNILNLIEGVRSMAEKKGSKFLIRLFGIGLTFVIGLFAASAVINYLTTKEFDLIATVKGITDGKALFAAGVMAMVVLLMMLISGDKSGPKLKGKDKMENQRFLKDDELDKTFKHCLYSELSSFSHTGVPFRVVKKGNNNLKIHFTPDCHTLIVGATGTGKTVSFIEPALQIIPCLKNKPSFFITDTKGELYAHHSQNLVKQGYKLVLLDLAEPYNSVQWNPLENIYTQWQKQLHLEEEILRHTNDPVKNYNFIKVGEIYDDEWYEFEGKAFASLKDALLEVEVEKSKIRDDCFENLNDIAAAICTIENKSEPSWEQGARDYFLAVLIAMLEDSENEALGMTKERYNFFNAYKIAMNKEEDFEVVKQYFNGRNPLSKTRQLAANITQTNAKVTRDGFMSTLNTKLSMFSDNGISFLTSRNDIDFYNMDEQPTAFFVKIPDERATRYTLASVCISQAYKLFVAKARANERTNSDKMAHLKRPVLYLMDEFANLPKVSELEKIITVARSRWIFLNMVIQSYSQLDNVYGKEVSEIVRGNCRATIFLGTPDLATREAFSKELGSYTIEQSSKTTPDKKDKKDAGGPTTSTSLTTVPLVYPSDLDKIPLGNNYTKIFGNYPVKSVITPYFKCTDIYKIGKYEMPFIPGRRMNEQEVFYDIRKRNELILSAYDE